MAAGLLLQQHFASPSPVRRRFSSCGFPAVPTDARKYALNSGIVKYLLWRKKVAENVGLRGK